MVSLTQSAAAMLLLGSATIDSLSLQGLIRQNLLRRHELAVDLLRSAAQSFAAAASGTESCLLLLAQTEWFADVQFCKGAGPFALSRGVVG